MVHPTGPRMGGLLGVADVAGQRALAEAFYEHAHRVCTEHARVYAGVSAMLVEVAGTGMPQGVVSNNQGVLVRTLVRHLELGDHLPVALGEEDVPAPKPDPRGVQLAAQRLGRAPSACIYVGDTLGDLHTAQAAGMACIGVSWGITAKSVLQSASFAAVIDHPRELPAVVARLAG